MTKARTFLYALYELQEQAEIAQAEVAYSRPEWLEEMNRELEKRREGETEGEGA